MIILYIPFTFDDAINDLFSKAAKWCDMVKKAGKKNPAVIYHQSGQEKIQANLEILHALQSGQCQIYIFGHGIFSPYLMIGNQDNVDDDYREISMVELSERFKSDLIIHGFSHNNIVKQYFCDMNVNTDKSKKMAEKFKESLGMLFSDLDVQYYKDVRVSIPQSNAGSDTGFSKRAYRYFEFSNKDVHFQLRVDVGMPSQFRHSLQHGLFSELKFKHQDQRNKSTPSVSFPDYKQHTMRLLAQNLVVWLQQDQIVMRYNPQMPQYIIDVLPTDINDMLTNKYMIQSQLMMLKIELNQTFLDEMHRQVGEDNSKEYRLTR